MPIVVERKLFATGDSLAVTLPKEWIRRHRLSPGQVVSVFARDDIVIRPAQRSDHQAQRKERNSFRRLRYSVLARDGFRCQYCGRSPKEDGVKLAIDQVVPTSKGGINEASNLITGCHDCNSGRGDLLLENTYSAQQNTDLTDLD